MGGRGKGDGATRGRGECASGGINFDQGFKVRQTMDMGYLVAGEMSGPGGDLIENGNNDTDLWVLKLDPSGNIIWQNVIGGQAPDAERVPGGVWPAERVQLGSQMLALRASGYACEGTTTDFAAL